MAKVFKTMDGNEAAAWISYAFSEVAGIYPITPSSPMAEHVDAWAGAGHKNIFGESVKVVEMQSEAGAAGFVHGSLQSGALTTTFTASQGLLLKIPNMYKIAGELLPCVFHVAARSLATHALSIFGDHQDIYAARGTGFAMLASNSVQEVMDLAGVAHLSAIKGKVPFLHFFDGFRTSHEIQKIEVMPYESLKPLLDNKALSEFRANAMSPNAPSTRGTAQNEDIYFQMRELANPYYEALPDIVAQYMEEISKITGRKYAPFTYFGDENATDIIIAMGSVCECAKEVVSHLNKKGQKVGVLCVHLYRPFSAKYFFKALPKSVERIAVLDRAKEPGSLGEPLYLDVCALFASKANAPKIIGGRYGLSSKDVSPEQLIAVYENLAKTESKNGFTIGIDDDVSFTSLECGEKISLANSDATECLFYGLGSDGTVGANKNSIKIIGDKTDFYAQAYFAYDSKKSGGYTRSHLRFSKEPICSTYLVSKADFIACSVAAYLDIYEVVEPLNEGGTFLLNSIWDKEKTIEKIPNKVKRLLAQKKAKFYIINATKLARDIGLKGRTNTIMQSAFFKLADIIPYEEAQKYMKEYAYKAYHKKGDSIVEMNYKAIEEGAKELVEIEVSPSWIELKDELKEQKYKGCEFVENIAKPMNAGLGDRLKTSQLQGYEKGILKAGTTQYEKRGVGVMVPKWIEQNCIQCNECAFVCPHGVIRAFLLDESEAQNAPQGVKEALLDAKGKEVKELKYKIQVSPLDCTGCELCAINCPSKEKSLVMSPLDEELAKGEQENADYLFNQVKYKDDLMSTDTLKGAMFSEPLFEFHGACPGCGETPYLTTLTRLFGKRLVIANATGCSSIYGGSAPSMPYKASQSGKGVAWANSLFEDNAEFGLGISMANKAMRTKLAQIIEQNQDKIEGEIKALCQKWLENKNNAQICDEIYEALVPMLENEKCNICAEILELKNYITKPSQWIVGGDGWAYDIGYGGIDHILSSGENVNILVLDTEVYSNTGGQSSKSSRTGSVAQFSASGKTGHKKDLGQIAMTNGDVYVAQINSNANKASVIKAFKEAEAYEGVSLIIAYSPCIAHGIAHGLGHSGAQGALATKCGYWATYTFNPSLAKEGKNPLKITSPAPDWSLYEQFLLNETRYSSLKKLNPSFSAELLEQNKQDAKRRYRALKRIANADYSDEIEE